MRYLIIVARHQSELAGYLTRQFSGDDNVQVILDRRRAERRQRAHPHAPDRRHTDRRRQPRVKHDLGTFGFVIVCRQQEPHLPLAALVRTQAPDRSGSPQAVQAGAWPRPVQRISQPTEKSEGGRASVPNEVTGRQRESFRQALDWLQSDNQRLKKERAEIIESLKQLVKQTVLLVNEAIAKLRDTAPESAAESPEQPSQGPGAVDISGELRERVGMVEREFGRLSAEVSQLRADTEKYGRQLEVLTQSLNKVVTDVLLRLRPSPP